jgi:RNA polymerase sigma-70 factor (ECF subfamily)
MASEVVTSGAMTDEEVVALYERSVGPLYRYAMRLTGGDRAWADELVQETYLQLVRRLRGGPPFQPDTGWLIVSCRHRFLDQLKQDRRRRERERRDVLSAVDAGATDATGDGPVTGALGRLPADYRVALVLRYVDELSVPDVARELGRSVHATESLLVRARAALRDVVANEVHDG